MMRPISEYREIIEERLLNYLPSLDEEGDAMADKMGQILFDAMEYSLKAGGKRLRPTLLLMANEMAGGDMEDGLPFAAAIEYIHTYSLIHDDLPAMDDDELRRGKPTNHVVFGEANAILAGDGLLNSAYEAIFNDLLWHIDRPDELSRRIKAAHAIARGAGVKGMVLGQTLDMESEGKEAEEETLKLIQRNKTGRLIEASILAGAYIGGGDEEMIKDLSSFGMKLGEAFQVADDILDVTGNVEELGKKIGSDKDNSKMTYVELLGLEKARELLKELTREGISHIEKYGERAEGMIKLAEEMEKRTY